MALDDTSPNTGPNTGPSTGDAAPATTAPATAAPAAGPAPSASNVVVAAPMADNRSPATQPAPDEAAAPARPAVTPEQRTAYRAARAERRKRRAAGAARQTGPRAAQPTAAAQAPAQANPAQANPAEGAAGALVPAAAGTALARSETRLPVHEGETLPAPTKRSAPATRTVPKPEPTTALPRPAVLGRSEAERAWRRRRRFWRTTFLFLFLLIVVAPTALAGWYYATTASDQYQSETRFAVRGTDSTPLSVLGLSALPGTGTEQADAYIVSEYIQSLQLFNDLRERGVDLRAFFARADIDPVYRIEADVPPEEFLSYWNWMTATDFNSTTSITTFQVNAFSAGDAATISRAVLDAAAGLVNELSTEARKQLIRTAEEEVRRTEARLAAARQTTTNFRDRVQTLDPQAEAASDAELITGLERELLELQARRTALLATVSQSSPSVRVLDRQIRAKEGQIAAQRQAIGSGEGEASTADAAEGGTGNLSAQLGQYSELLLEEQFAQEAYKGALSSLETAQAEARKQERYFAIVVEPTTPQASLYPERVVNTFLVLLVGFLVWLFVYLVLQSVRDHAA